MPFYGNSAGYEHYLAYPLDRPSWCMDCGTKLDYDRDHREELCGACYKVRLDDPCPDCGAGGGQECLLSCGSRLV